MILLLWPISWVLTICCYWEGLCWLSPGACLRDTKYECPDHDMIVWMRTWSFILGPVTVGIGSGALIIMIFCQWAHWCFHDGYSKLVELNARFSPWRD